jgi:hypothetical protein
MGGVELQFQSFLNPALDGSEWSAPRPEPFTCGVKSPLYPLNMNLGGPHSRSESLEDERNLLLLPGINTQMRLPARTLITKPTEISRIIILHIFIPFDMYMSQAAVISCDLENLGYRTVIS